MKRTTQAPTTPQHDNVLRAKPAAGESTCLLARHAVRRTYRAVRLAQRSLIASIAPWQSDQTGALFGTIDTLAGWVAETGRGDVAWLPRDAPVAMPAATSIARLPSAFSAPETIVFPRPYAARVPAARLLGPEGCVVLDRRVVLDVSPAYGRDARDHPALMRLRRPAPTLLHGTVLVLTGIDFANHYHWLLDVLPRLAVARDAGMRWDRVMAPAVTGVQQECLARLGICRSRLVRPPWNAQVDVEEAVIPSFPSARLSPSPYAIRFARDLFATALKRESGLPRRLYVTRDNAARRHTKNELEVRTLLESRGFATFRLDGLTAHEQARRFANADVIVASHGAALANLAFCRPGTHVVELFARRFTPRIYQRLAAIAGLDYACLVDGAEARIEEGGRYRDDDLAVNVASLGCLV